MTHGVPVITAGGAGGQLDPTRIMIEGLCAYDTGPSASKYALDYERNMVSREIPRRNSAFRQSFPANHSVIPESGASCDEPPALNGLNCAGYGSSVCVTAPFGLFAASEVLRHLAERPTAQV